MQNLRKTFNNLAFRYYSLLAHITNGKHHFVNKKLVFGALLIGISGQFACKPNDQKNNTLPQNKDIENDEIILCYETGPVSKDTSDNKNLKNQTKNNRTDTTKIINMCYKAVLQVEPKCYKVAMPNRSDDDTLTPYNAVEQMPQFPGGDEKLIQFLQKNLIFPEHAIENQIFGTVYITFIIESDGTVSNPRILRGIGSGCDEEAIRVIKLIPRWIPGKQNGKTVRVQYNLPIKFKLDDEKK